jgi:hypothetical protein
MIARQARIDVFQDTERIMGTGRYRGPAGEVELAPALSAAVAATVHYAPEDPLPGGAPPAADRTATEVSTESSLDSARRLVPAVMSKGLGDFGGAVESEHADHEVAQRGHDARAVPVRICDRSSSEVTPRTQCSRFSTFQGPRT